MGGRVPSSATVAAQPDSRNLLARGHLWVSGKSFSASSGTDIQQQYRTTVHPFWPAPCALAGLPPYQSGLSSPHEGSGRDHVPGSAPSVGPHDPAAFLAAPSFSGPADSTAKNNTEPARLLGNAVLGLSASRVAFSDWLRGRHSTRRRPPVSIATARVHPSWSRGTLLSTSVQPQLCVPVGQDLKKK